MTTAEPDRLWWVRVDGHARVVSGGPERDRAVEFLAAKYPQYRDEPPSGPAIIVDIDRTGGDAGRLIDDPGPGPTGQELRWVEPVCRR